VSPLDYSLCDQTVTVYRRNGEGIARYVVECCYFSRQTATSTEHYGKSRLKPFLLIIPGDAMPLQPGDRIFAGIGPEKVDWQAFVPAAVPELYEVSFAKPCFWEGAVIHWEAGAERRLL